MLTRQSHRQRQKRFYVEALRDRRLNKRTGTYDYLVRWGGFAKDEDSWEPMAGLPHDMCIEFDALQRGSKRSRRAVG